MLRPEDPAFRAGELEESTHRTPKWSHTWKGRISAPLRKFRIGSSGGAGNRTRVTFPPHRRSIVSFASKGKFECLLPCHRPPLVEGGRRSPLAESRPRLAEVALSPGLEDSWPEADAEFLPPRFDGSFETNCVVVSSKAPSNHGETEHLDDLLELVSGREGASENAQPVLLRQGVVLPVLSAIGEVVTVL